MDEVPYVKLKLPSDEYHWALIMISQQYFRQWLGAVRQQAITWANVASLGHSELNPSPWVPRTHLSHVDNAMVLMIWWHTELGHQQPWGGPGFIA